MMRSVTNVKDSKISIGLQMWEHEALKPSKLKLCMPLMGLGLLLIY